ncbi:hypothetical protein H4R19_002338 [Coemansia spiralis]|nr:hypothetical protein H4R19_002338 [Coemansia spiralis]
MWISKVRQPLQEHAYALYPLVTIATVVAISYRISSLSRSHGWQKIPSPWSTVVSFGDSFSDSGNGAQITSGKYPSEPWYWHHRFSNGPNWVDNLILDLGGLDKIKMRNFAHGGATTDNALLPGILLGHTIPGTHQQVRGFMLKSRRTEYPKAESTLYTIWTGANDCLALGGVGPYKAGHRGTIKDVEESIFQDILQLERESHNKIKYVLVLTPPPVEDMPLVKHESQSVREAVQEAAEELTSGLPRALLGRFSTLGRATMKDSTELAPAHPAHSLPNHRVRAAAPIAHYISADLPLHYDHLLPGEHNGTRPQAQPDQSQASDGLHHQLRKREGAHPPVTTPHAKGPAVINNRVHIMVYDAYHFIKHAEANPHCFGLDPAMLGKPCGDQKHCYDRVWIDDANIGTQIHYWMARDINIRLHLWHMRNTNVNLDRMFKNNTRARELELEMLGYACPMRPAPILF